MCVYVCVLRGDIKSSALPQAGQRSARGLVSQSATIRRRRRRPGRANMVQVRPLVFVYAVHCHSALPHIYIYRDTHCIDGSTLDVHRVTLWTLATHDCTGLLKNRKRTTRTHRRQYTPLSWIEACHVPDSPSVTHTYTIVYHATYEHITVHPIVSFTCALTITLWMPIDTSHVLYITCISTAVLG